MNKLLAELSTLLTRPHLNRSDLRLFIEAHLPELQSLAYAVIKDHPGCTSFVVSIALDTPPNQTGNLLHELLELNLIYRQSRGGVYRYSVTP